MDQRPVEQLTITDEADYQRVQLLLGEKRRPPAILRALMSMFESYRQARKIGWSRPWNKQGVMTFCSYRVSPDDHDLLRAAVDVVQYVGEDLTPIERALARDLLSSPPLGFMFLSEIERDGRRMEAITLSLGRINHDNRRHRDRLDVILESEIVDGTSRGLSGVRIYSDPHDGTRTRAVERRAPATLPAARRLFESCLERSHAWLPVPERHWEHWTSAYIDYFGPRRWPLDRALLPDPASLAGRALVADAG